MTDTHQITIPYSEYEYFKDLLFFDGYYYLLTYKQNKEREYNSIAIRMYSVDLNLLDTATINFADYNVTTKNFIGKTVISENLILAPLKFDKESAILFYDRKSHNIELYPFEYNLIGIVSDNNKFYCVGYYDNNIIFQEIAETKQIISENKAVVPFIDLTNLYSPHKIDNRLYMYGDNIYMIFTSNDLVYFTGYNVVSNEWSKILVVESANYNAILMDYKYVIRKGGVVYDLYPHTNNKFN